MPTAAATRRWTLAVATGVVGAAVILGASALDRASDRPAPAGSGRGDAPVAVADERPPRAASAVRDAPHRTPVEVARIDGVALTTVSPATLVVGFHEAAGAAALPLQVIAPVAADHAGAGVQVERGGGAGDVTVMVLPSRRRATTPTTAMDVVVAEGQPILAPVDGTVVKVEDYRLYGAEPDVRIEIVPAAAPHLVVVLLHVVGPEVMVGDTVEIGETVLAAGARPLAVASQIDRYTRRSREADAVPHVHIEVHER